MILSPKQIDHVYNMVGEDPSPGTGIAGLVIAISSAITGDIWAKPVDIAILGGDPVTALSCAISFLEGSTMLRAPRIALLPSPNFSCAPLATLEDQALAKSLAERGAISTRMLHDLKTNADRPVQAMMEQMAKYFAAQATDAGARIFLARTLTEGSPLSSRKVLLRLTTPHDDEDVSLFEKSPGQDRKVVDLFDRSASLSRYGWATVFKALRGVAQTPPRTTPFANVFVADRVTLLSGFVSPTTAGYSPQDSSNFSEKHLQQTVFDLARGAPSTVRDAVKIWEADLKRARAVHSSATSQK